MLVPKMKARLYVGVASNDDARQPDAKDKLQRGVRGREGAGRSRGLPGPARLVRAGHAGRSRQADLQQADAERAWTKLLALYKTCPAVREHDRGCGELPLSAVWSRLGRLVA